MRDVLDDIEKWSQEGLQVALATVIDTWGSAPRGIGAKMAHTATGFITGSVSGGCVEGAVYDAGLEVLETGRPQLLHFGVSDESAWDVGLACGGSIQVFVEKLDTVLYNFARDLIRSDHSFAIATVIKGPSPHIGNKIIVQRGGRIFGEIDPTLEGTIAAIARSALSGGESQRRRMEMPVSQDEPVDVFVEVIGPAPTLVIVGGVHIAIVLSAIAKALGYRTIVIDPRRAFGSQERFKRVDRLIQKWPDAAFSEMRLTSSTAVAILTHDPKIDDAALMNVLTSPVFYIGALGSRKTHSARRARLIAAGVPEEQMNRIHAPVGIDIGADSPEEIAVAIMAEIIASRHAG